jgi:hypothetical protein
LKATARALPVAALLFAASIAHGQRADTDVLPGNRAEPLGSCGGGARPGAAAVNEAACDAPLDINGTPTRMRCGAAAIGAFEMCGHSLERATAPRQGYLCEARSRGGVLTLVGAPMMGTQDGRVSISARLSGEPHDVMFGDSQHGWSVQASDERDGQAVSTVIVSLRADRVFQVEAMSFERNGGIAQQLRCEVRARPR